MLRKSIRTLFDHRSGNIKYIASNSYQLSQLSSITTLSLATTSNSTIQNSLSSRNDVGLCSFSSKSIDSSSKSDSVSVSVSSTDFIQMRLDKRIEMLDKNMHPYAHNFDNTHSSLELQELYKDLPSGEENNDNVSLSGRILLKRNFGKLMFLTIKDHISTIQIYIDSKNLDIESVEH